MTPSPVHASRRASLDQTRVGTGGPVDQAYWSESYVNELLADELVSTNVLFHRHAGHNNGAKRVFLEKQLPRDLPFAIPTAPVFAQATALLTGNYFGAEGLWAWRGTSATASGRVGWCLLGPAFNAGPDVHFVVDLITGHAAKAPAAPISSTEDGARLRRLLTFEHAAARDAATALLARANLAAELRDAVDAARLDVLGGDRPARLAAAVYASLPGGTFAATQVDTVYIGAPLWVYRNWGAN